MYNYNPEEEIIEVDNFFPTYIQKEIANHLLDKSINWIYNSTLSYGIKSTYNLEWTKHSKIQETDGFSAQIDSEGSIYRQVTQNVKTFVKKNYNLDIIHFLRVMFVIIPPNPLYNLDYHMTPHIDSSDKLPYKNFLYYINDNDAETLFFNQKFHISKPTDFTNQAIIRRVKPKQNKAVIWDGSIFHAGNVSTSHKRLTLNILFK